MIVQEYVAKINREDWLFHGVCDDSGKLLMGFSGQKLLSFPRHMGPTALGVSQSNSLLYELVASFCRLIRFSGVFSMDIMLDRRDGAYKFLDFNPRVGGIFRLFENDQGIDVIRGLHLNLTGRKIPAGLPVDGRKLIVENYARQAFFPFMKHYGAVERAWFEFDDPLPSILMRLRWFFYKSLQKQPIRNIAQDNIKNRKDANCA